MISNVDTYKQSISTKYNAQQLLDLARDWIKQGNATVAYQLLEDAYKLNDVEKNKILKGEISKEIGRVFMQDGQWERAEEAYKKATELFLEKGYYKGAAESTRNLANLKFQLGQFSLSNSLCEKAIEWATNSGDFQLRATVFNTQGAICSIEGRQKESIKILNLCLSDFRRAGNLLRQAYVQHNIGLAHMELGEYSQAKKSLENALASALENKDTNLVEMCYQNLAKIHLKKSDFATARSLIKIARALLDSLKSPNLALDLDIIEVECMRLAGDLNRANDIVENALKIAREQNLLQHEAELLYEGGVVAAEKGQLESARSRLEASIALFKKTGGAQIDKAINKLRNLNSVAKNNTAAK